MASKRQLDDTETNPNLSVWEIPVSELRDRAGKVWGRCPDKREDKMNSPTHPKVRQIEPRRRSADDRAATA